MGEGRAPGGAAVPGGGGGSDASPPATLVSVTAARTSMRCPHLRHFMRTVFPATLSSEIWYFALHWSQRNFT